MKSMIHFNRVTREGLEEFKIVLSLHSPVRILKIETKNRQANRQTDRLRQRDGQAKTEKGSSNKQDKERHVIVLKQLSL